MNDAHSTFSKARLQGWLALAAKPARRRIGLALTLLLSLAFAGPAFATLTVIPATWDIVGLDSNTPATGPNHFPVGARVCSNTNTTNVTVNFVWDSATATYIYLTPGTPSSLTLAIAAGTCQDAYFDVEINPVAASFDKTRTYHITATDGSGTASSPTPRQLYVEHLISQSRNGVVEFYLNGVLQPIGSTMNLQLGNTYTIKVRSFTATNGYNQLENFINLPGYLFQTVAVSSTYTINTSPYVPTPNPSVYADACGWDANPSSPSYRSCIGGDYKVGGNVVDTTYTVKIIGGAGTTTTLNALEYDFSGSSFHYNANFSSASITANIIGPAFSKAFTPAATGGTSTLSFTIQNTSSSAISDVGFTDTLPTTPGAMVVAPTPAASTSNCGSPTFAPTAGAATLTFSNGTIAAGATCTISVAVSVPANAGTYVNTTGPLFIGALNTGLVATASLNAQPAGTPTGICGQDLATWTFENLTASNNNITPPIAANSGISTTKTMSWIAGAGNPNNGLDGRIEADAPSHPKYWSGNGWPNAAPVPLNSGNGYIQFQISASSFGASLAFAAKYASPNGPTNISVWVSSNGTSFTQAGTTQALTTAWASYGAFSIPAGTQYVRIYGYNAKNMTNSADFDIDDIAFIGCGPAIQPALTKVFSPNPVAVNGVSTLTFTLTNTNTAPLTGVKFIDPLPAGLEVAATPSASTTCGNSPSWAPTAGATVLNFGQTTGATIPASGSCTVTVSVKATTAGAHNNVSGLISSIEGGTNNTGNGSASASLTALLPPVIDKAFATGTVLLPGQTTLTFVITNPNTVSSLTGVAFTDTYPAGLTNASTPGATNTCGGSVTAASNGPSISLSGGTLAAGASCKVSVAVTSASANTYLNSVTASATTAGTGNTASDTVTFRQPNGGISLLKQVSTSPSGPWTTFLNVDTSSPANVYYRFTLENIGDVALSPVSVSDPKVAASGCAWPNPLPYASGPTVEPTATCVVGPVTALAGNNPNTATATGYYGATAYTDTASAGYFGAAPGFNLLKEISTSASGPWSSAINIATGTSVYYRFTLSNTGNVALSNPNVTDPTVAGAAACASTFTNPLAVGGASYCVVGPVTASSTPNTTVTNTAQGHGTPPSGPTINTANSSANYTTSGTTILTLAKSHPGHFYQGQQGAVYTLTVGNTGTGATSGPITVTDALPVGLSFVSGTGAGWSCSASGQTVTCIGSTSIPASGASAITLTVNVAGNAGSPLTNVAQASGGGAANTPTASDPTAVWIALSGAFFKDNGRGSPGNNLARNGIQDGTEPNFSVSGAAQSYVVILDSNGFVLAVADICPYGSITCLPGDWTAAVPAGTGYTAYITSTTPPLLNSHPTPNIGAPAGFWLTKPNYTPFGGSPQVPGGASPIGSLTFTPATGMRIGFGAVSSQCST